MSEETQTSTTAWVRWAVGIGAVVVLNAGSLVYLQGQNEQRLKAVESRIENSVSRDSLLEVKETLREIKADIKELSKAKPK